MRIVVLYDGGADDWSPEDVQSVLEPVREVSAALQAAGHEVAKVPVHRNLEWFDRIRSGVDLVFNLCEGVGGTSQWEYKVASAIELAGIPYTGGSAWMMTVCHRKPLLNAVLQAAGLPIPRWHVPDHEPVPEDLPLPAIVKPAEEDASVGIEQSSIVTTREQLVERVACHVDDYGSVIVQQYIAGREIAVAFVGDTVLPLSEIDFGRMPKDAWRIVSFDAKWTPESPEYSGTQPVCPAQVDQPLAERIVEVSRAAWRAVEGCGYGRVDLRVDAQGRPWILEVNPSPDITSDAGLVNMSRAYGWSYAQLVSRIVEVALAEAEEPPASPVMARSAGDQVA
ncbi:MAG: ATP-grasp domain-containing protein [Gemmatimonadales bacterium]